MSLNAVFSSSLLPRLIGSGWNFVNYNSLLIWAPLLSMRRHSLISRCVTFSEHLHGVDVEVRNDTRRINRAVALPLRLASALSIVNLLRARDSTH